MTELEIKHIVNEQRTFFETGKTLDIEYRIAALKKLRAYITKYEQRINEALYLDLGKSPSESYMCETGMALSELTYMIKHVRKYAKAKCALTPLAQFPAISYQLPSPYGVCLVMSPWNYPFLLTIDPLIDAIAAGNTVVLKPSAYSPNTTALICELISKCFEPQYVSVITGGRAENTYLLNEHFDYIFFTGSKAVGKTVMAAASSHLTPVTLELGGKSPCIVDASANIKLAAKRIVFGKYLNCGQTCIAPDYVLCHKSVKDKLIKEIKRQITIQYTSTPLENKSYGKIISKKHFDRLLGLIDENKLVYGGLSNPDTLQIEPTLLDDVTFEDKVMQEEIFGPILPIISFGSIDAIISLINTMEHPLALYIFASDKSVIKNVTTRCRYGGGCINDTIIHLATCEMGFGGFGESGMGSYHGKAGFDTFSHYKSIVDKKTWLDLPLRYQPYSKFYDKLVHMFLK